MRHEFFQVCGQGMVRHAGQGHSLLLADRAGGQGDLTNLCQYFRILVKGFIEVTQTKQQQRVGMLRLQL